MVNTYEKKRKIFVKFSKKILANRNKYYIVVLTKNMKGAARLLM